MVKRRIVLAVILITVFSALCVGSDVAAGDARQGQWTASETDTGYVVFSHSTLELLGAEYVPSCAAIVEKVSCALARNEYESLQIGVHAIGAELADVRLEVESDLEVKVYHGIDGYKLLDGNVAGGLAAGKNSNFWLTFHATRETPAGMHAGKIRIKPADHEETVLDLEIRVRPIVLNRPRISIGIYYPQGGGDDR